MIEKDLKLKLINYSRAILKEIKKSKRLSSDDTTEYLEVFIPDLRTMKFKDGKIKYILEIRKKEKEEEIGISFLDPKLYEEVCLNHPEFNDLLTHIKDEFKIKKNKENSFLQMFFQKLVYEYSKGVSDSELSSFIQDFIDELKGKPPEYSVKIYIDGIWLDMIEHQIFDNILIRRIRPNDFKSYNRENLEAIFWGRFGDFPYIIVEMMFKSKLKLEDYEGTEAQIEIQYEIHSLVFALLLFKFGSVFCHQFEIQQNGFLGHYGRAIHGSLSHQRTPQIKSRHNYVIFERDIHNLKEIIQIFTKPEIKNILFTQAKDINHINIALQRYQNAYLNIENLESQISYAISSLEALYSTKGKDLTRKLCQRISLLFEILGFSSLPIYRIVKKSYQIRSYYSHGEIVKIRDRKLYTKETRTLARQLLECARISLLIFIQIDPILKKKDKVIALTKYRNLKRKAEHTIQKKRKDYFINVLDNALVDNKTYIRLRNFIRKNCKCYLT